MITYLRKKPLVRTSKPNREGMSKQAMRTKKPQKPTRRVILLRLIPEVDQRMRRWIERRGQLQELVREMMERVDFDDLELLDTYKKGTFNKQLSSVAVSEEHYLRLKLYAALYGQSMSCIINSGMDQLASLKELDGQVPNRRKK